MGHQQRLQLGGLHAVGQEQSNRQQECAEEYQTVVEQAVDEVEVPRFHTVQLGVTPHSRAYIRTTTDTEDIIQNDINRGDDESVSVVVIDGEIEAEDDEHDGQCVQNCLNKTSAVNAIESHRDEDHTNEWPVIDDCRCANEQTEEVIIVHHPDTIREENGDHCERCVDEARAGCIHARREKKEEE